MIRRGIGGILAALAAAMAGLACANPTPPRPAGVTDQVRAVDGTAPSKSPDLLRLAPAAATDVQPAPAAALLALESELGRGMRELARQAPAPHFISYQLTARREVEIRAVDGALEASTDVRGRTLDVDVRVGTQQSDSTHELDGVRPRKAIWIQVPIEDDPVALTASAWRATLDGYRGAAARFAALESRTNARLDRAPVADFSREVAVRHVEAVRQPDIARAAWEARLRAASARFSNVTTITEAFVLLQVTTLEKWFVNSEKTLVQTSGTWTSLWIKARALAPDGELLERTRRVSAGDPSELPDEAALNLQIDGVITELEALRTAPVADPYNGPVLLDGRAAAVFIHESFGHRVEGESLKSDSSGQTFNRKVGQPILPGFLSIYDNPMATKLGAAHLNGSYLVDDEGVPAAVATLVQDGVLRGFLLGRSPLVDFPRSNGHGRHHEGFPVAARQGNLVTVPSRSLTRSQLRARLLEETARKGKTYGFFVTDINGGFTRVVAGGGQSLVVRPTLIYRVYVDGRPDELVRGVNLVGTPLTLLSRILAAGDDYAAFNGECGASSGAVPVSGVSPSLLLGEVELERSQGHRDSPAILVRPASEASNAAQGASP